MLVAAGVVCLLRGVWNEKGVGGLYYITLLRLVKTVNTSNTGLRGQSRPKSGKVRGRFTLFVSALADCDLALLLKTAQGAEYGCLIVS